MDITPSIEDLNNVEPGRHDSRIAKIPSHAYPDGEDAGNDKPILHDLRGIEVCHFRYSDFFNRLEPCGGYTVAARKFGRRIIIAAAKCHQNERFDKKIGYKLARQRLIEDWQTLILDLSVYDQGNFRLKETIELNLRGLSPNILPPVFEELKLDFDKDRIHKTADYRACDNEMFYF